MQNGAVMRRLAHDMVSSLVDKGEAVEVESHEVDGRVLLTVRVDREDLRFVIGKDGRTARSLRTIVYAAALKKGIKCQMEIAVPEACDGAVSVA